MVKSSYETEFSFNILFSSLQFEHPEIILVEMHMNFITNLLEFDCVVA